MKTHTQIEYNLLDDHDPENLLYQVIIRGEEKMVKFRKQPDGSYAGYPDFVYVSISPPVEHSYENMVRRANLRLNAKRELLDLYSVMDKNAYVISWKNSELGNRYGNNESFDSHFPYPVGRIELSPYCY